MQELRFSRQGTRSLSGHLRLSCFCLSCFCLSCFCLSGGGGTTYDTGTVTANVNGTAVTTSYGESSTAQTVAAALATAINGAGAGVTAIPGASGAITVSATQPGTAANGWPVTLSSASNQPKYFSSASFTGTSGTLSGGTGGSTAPGTIYQYTIPAPGAQVGYAPNGNLMSYSDCVPTCITGAWSMNYSSLNQLAGVKASSGPWGPVSGQPGLTLSWIYDPFGNRTTQTASGTPSTEAPPTQSWVYSTSNQSTTSTYDPSGVGFVTADVANQYAYDNEGRLCAVSHSNGMSTIDTQYIYDAEGRRVAMGTIQPVIPPGYSFSTAKPCNPSNNQFALSESYILGQSGEHISELDGSGNFLRGHVYANGQLLATYTTTGTEFAFNDWLGTKRLVANANGSVAGTCMSLPFGDELSCGGSVTLNGHHFTGQIHDQSGNDYFGARYYSENTGRFLSPDPSGLYYADPTNPQSLNLYSYSLNNPLTNTDPTGLYCYYGDTSAGSADWGDDSQYDFSSDKATCEGNTSEGGGKWYDDPSTTVTVNGNGSSSFVNTTLPTSTAYITPIAQTARTALLGTLTNANPCSAFFDEASSQSGQGPSGQLFANTDIRLNPNAGTLVGGQSEQGSGSAGPIFINPNSAFSKSSVTVNGQSMAIAIGPFKGGTQGAQEGILAHELGHKTNAIPSDAKNVNQSLKNTDTVMHYCANQF
jgi:RHS repeat-associated protein